MPPLKSKLSIWRISMFNFGKGKIDNAIVENLSAALVNVLGDKSMANETSKNIIQEVKAALNKKGIDPYKTNRGDELMSDINYLKLRLDAGLTKHDILSYWNRYLLLVFSELKFRDVLAFTFIRSVELCNGDVYAAAHEWKVKNPRYGNPDDYYKNPIYYKDLTLLDAPIFEEFQRRIATWSENTPENTVDMLISEYGSYNSMVRHLVEQNRL